MKKEDFNKEVSELFEEDSVLAQAVLNIRERREKISSEKKENKDKSHEEHVSANADGSLPDAGDASPSVEIGTADFDEKNPDFSLTVTETLAINPDDVIPHREEADAEEVAPETSGKPKKLKLFSKRKKSDIPNSEPIKLLDFVTNEASSKSDQPDDDVNPEAELSPSTETVTEDDIMDGNNDESTAAAGPNEEIFPEADEHTSIPDFDDTDGNGVLENSDDAEVQPYIETPEEPSLSGEEMYLTSFESPVLEIDSTIDTADSVAETETEEELSSSIEEETIEEDDASEEKNATTDKSSSDSGKNEKTRFIDGVFDFIELFIFSLAAVLLITTFFFRHSVVEGSSMEQTLFDGEHILISNFMYEPQRGDIIVCEDYSLDAENLHKPIVKRIIGLPGDLVEFKKKGLYSSEVYVNGEKLQEDYVFIDGPDYTEDNGKWIVEEGKILVMGDHRNNSSDSRDPRVGTIRIDSIIGKALIRFYPFEKFGKIE